jgi:phosphatidylglycerophosphate synthase
MTQYSYRSSLKSDISDEPVNTFLIRPLAGILVRMLHPTGVTPNQVTIAATAFGLFAAWFYAQGIPSWTAAAGVCLTLKDLLDSADGQLARVKAMYSRTGRFLDSIGDFVVNIAVFSAIATAMVRAGEDSRAIAACVLAFLGISLRVSYHVFYHTSYLHLQGTYSMNRTSEVLSDADHRQDRITLLLQRIYLFLYGWQDAIIARLDMLCRGRMLRINEQQWYGDHVAIRMSAFLGIGTELLLLTVFSIANRLGDYLWVNIAGMNLWWGICVGYRRFVLRAKVEVE